MWPDRVLNPGPLTYESGALPTALSDPASLISDFLTKTECKRPDSLFKISFQLSSQMRFRHLVAHSIIS